MKSKCFSLLLLFLFSLVSIGAYAQVKVEGSVFDETDNPLIGVSVFTEGRKTGTVTNADGHFTIILLVFTQINDFICSTICIWYS